MQQFTVPAQSAALTTAVTNWNNYLSGAAATAAQTAAATAQSSPTEANRAAMENAWRLAQGPFVRDALVQAFADEEVRRRVALEAAIQNAS